MAQASLGLEFTLLLLRPLNTGVMSVAHHAWLQFSSPGSDSVSIAHIPSSTALLGEAFLSRRLCSEQGDTEEKSGRASRGIPLS